jgi:hypothetical protein
LLKPTAFDSMSTNENKKEEEKNIREGVEWKFRSVDEG